MHGDEDLEFGGDFLWVEFSEEELLAEGVDFDLGKDVFECSVFFQQEVHVGGVLKISDERCLGQHRAKQSARGSVSGSAAVGSFEVAEELFEDVVGSLRLNLNGAGGGLNGDGIGEEFFPVLVDLGDHLLNIWALSVILPACEPSPESRDSLLEGADVGFAALVVEAVGA